MRPAKSPGADAAFARWAAGYGAIRHTRQTRARMRELAAYLESTGTRGDGVPLFELLAALDRVTSAAMWLVVHETYARRVRLDGGDLGPDDFKPSPEGHTGGALNMVPAYAGYLAAERADRARPAAGSWARGTAWPPSTP